MIQFDVTAAFPDDIFFYIAGYPVYLLRIISACVFADKMMQLYDTSSNFNHVTLSRTCSCVGLLVAGNSRRHILSCRGLSGLN